MKFKLINKKIIAMSLILVFVITMAQFIFVTNSVMAATTILPAGSTANDLQTAVNNSAPGDVIIISSDITLDLGIFIASEKDITIQSTIGNNWSLLRTQYGQFHFNVVGKLTLQNITIEGGSTGGQLYVNGGDITLNNDAIIQNCFSPDVGGGISVQRGNLIMNGNSAVRDCYARVGGGGIYVSNGTLTMNDESSVRNCYLTSRTTSVGGGVNVFNSTFTMNNNSVITECLSNLDGGGVFTHESTFNMNSGSITKNTANRGGGIYVHSGETIIENATISENNAVISENIVEGNGGGIYVANAGNLEITGNTSITNNNALNGNGGGIYTENKQYENLTTGSNTQFSDNISSMEITPPTGAQDLYPNIGFASTSIYDHPLNNHDINYSDVYGIIYDANGGTGGLVIPDVVPGSIRIVLPLEDTEIERPGYRFIEWNTEQDGSGINYEPGDSMTINSDVTLYAQWRAEGEYNVIFESNGGSYIENQVIAAGETITKPADPTRQGYIFEGWYTDNGTFLNEWDFNIPVTDDLTLYAKWTKDPNDKSCNCIWIFIIVIILLFLEKIIRFIKCKNKCKKIRKEC